jgi:hypothetical protein
MQAYLHHPFEYTGQFVISIKKKRKAVKSAYQDDYLTLTPAREG